MRAVLAVVLLAALSVSPVQAQLGDLVGGVTGTVSGAVGGVTSAVGDVTGTVGQVTNSVTGGGSASDSGGAGAAPGTGQQFRVTAGNSTLPFKQCRRVRFEDLPSPQLVVRQVSIKTLNECVQRDVRGATMVERVPALVQALASRGWSMDDFVTLTAKPDGAVTLYVYRR